MAFSAIAVSMKYRGCIKSIGVQIILRFLIILNFISILRNCYNKWESPK